MTVKSETRVINMGCRLNAHESEVIRQNAKHAGLSNAVVVNTCAVTREAERQARQTIRKARRENPGATLIVTGCAAQLDPESYYRIDGVNMVIGNIEKMTARFLTEIEGGIHVTDIMSIKETAGHLARGTVLRDFGSRTRAFVRFSKAAITVALLRHSLRPRAEPIRKTDGHRRTDLGPWRGAATARSS